LTEMSGLFLCPLSTNRHCFILIYKDYII